MPLHSFISLKIYFTTQAHFSVVLEFPLFFRINHNKLEKNQIAKQFLPDLLNTHSFFSGLARLPTQSSHHELASSEAKQSLHDSDDELSGNYRIDDSNDDQV